MASIQALRDRWAILDQELLTYVGRHREPEAQRIIKEQKDITKLLHHVQRKDVGDPEHVGVPGGVKDVVVVGAGPAGLSASIYGASEGLETVLIDAKPKAGGQARMSSRIENVLGFPAGVTGKEYAEMSLEQAERLGTKPVLGVRVEGLEFDEETGLKHLKLSNGKEMVARSVIIAGGVQFRKQEFPGSDLPDVVYGDSTEMKKRCRGGDVVVVGGANSAGQAAIDAATVAKHVTVVIRKGSINDKMSRSLVDQLLANPKVTVIEGAEVESAEAGDDGRLVSVKLKDGRVLPCASLGLFIGSMPEADWAQIVNRNERGFIVVGEEGSDPLETNIPGVFAAGDVRQGAMARVISAASDGAQAVSMTHGYLARQKEKKKKSVADVIAHEAAQIPNDLVDRWMDIMHAWDQQLDYTDVDEAA